MKNYILSVLLIIALGGCLYIILCPSYNIGSNLAMPTETVSTMTDLFDKQFSHLLATMTILITVFGLALPLATYFFQQKNLSDEKKAIEHEVQQKFAELEQVKRDIFLLQQTANKLESSLSDCNLGVSSFFNNTASDTFQSFFEEPRTWKVRNFLSHLGYFFKYASQAKKKKLLLHMLHWYNAAPLRFQSKSKEIFDIAIKEFCDEKEYRKNYMFSCAFRNLIGADSKEYIELKNSYKAIFNAIENDVDFAENNNDEQMESP